MPLPIGRFLRSGTSKLRPGHGPRIAANLQLFVMGTRSEQNGTPEREILMAHRAFDVLIVTNDDALWSCIRQRRPDYAKLTRVRPTELLQKPLPACHQLWIDLDSTSETPPSDASRHVYFWSSADQRRPDLHPGTFIRKPVPTTVLDVLWATTISPTKQPRNQSTAEDTTLPAWILDYHELELKALCRRIVTRLPTRLGYRLGSLYLHDPRRQLLTLADTSHTRPLDIVIPLDASSTHLMAQAANSRQMVRSQNVRQHLTERAITRVSPRPADENTCLVVPLVNADQLHGVLNLTGKAPAPPSCTPTTRDLILKFIAQALQFAVTHRQARTEARVDGLTGLYNRRWIVEALEREIRRAERFNNNLTILMVDLDGLKAVNDRQGHAAGDAILRQIASRITSVLRHFDGAARVGGDEFIIMLPNTNLHGALQVARRLLRSVHEDRAYDPEPHLPVRASIGAVAWHRGDTPDQLINRADQAMYAAKQQGGNRVICDPASTPPAALDEEPEQPIDHPHASRFQPETPTSTPPPAPYSQPAVQDQLKPRTSPGRSSPSENS